ncbi:cupin domain-containing protein [Pseudovibrio exalbescens]|uniref:cupin domain-containing protein n=1 Tax=Pseudovibrio exalbescens TaxID=197461 RepID=UPI001AD8B7D7|nr:cupin domain-containing protein [Pseudovibrio exalbescens]
MLAPVANMYKTSERDHTYRFDDHGPKYLQRGPRSDIGVVTLQPGQHFPAHKHCRIEENFLTIEGEVHMYVDGNLHVLGVGDFLRCEPGEAHYVVNHGDVPWKAVFIKAPYDPKDGVPVDWTPEQAAS